MSQDLYDKDYYLWLQKTVHCLQNNDFSKVDIPNLVEEIEDIGRSRKKAVKSN